MKVNYKLTYEHVKQSLAKRDIALPRVSLRLRESNDASFVGVTEITKYVIADYPDRIESNQDNDATNIYNATHNPVSRLVRGIRRGLGESTYAHHARL